MEISEIYSTHSPIFAMRLAPCCWEKIEKVKDPRTVTRITLVRDMLKQRGPVLGMKLRSLFPGSRMGSGTGIVNTLFDAR